MCGRNGYGAGGVSPTLFDPKSYVVMRKTWRQLLFGTVAPLRRRFSTELSAKLFTLTIEWQKLRGSDLQGRARAIQSLATVGMDQEWALEMDGLISEK